MDQPPDAVSQISGNASDNIKRIMGSFFQNFHQEDVGFSAFGDSIEKRMKIVEISVNKNGEEERKLEARVVIELDVTEGQCRRPFQALPLLLIVLVLDMLNRGGNMHGGCAAFLVDM